MTQLSHTFTKRVKEQNLDLCALIKETLEDTNGNLKAAAKQLGLTRQGLQYHMEANGITIKRCVVETKNAS